jgi:endo-1,4-beta-D-glucanase Y
MKLNIALIPYGQISYYIPSLLKYFQESEGWTKGRANVDDIVRFAMTGTMQLWVVYEPENGNVHGYVMTEIKQYPQKKMFVIQYCAMDPNHMQFVADVMHETADRFARDMNCSGVEFFGRPGWEPHVRKHGYAKKTVVYEKHFDEVKS